MKPICVFYHCLLKGHERVIEPDYALALIADQMNALRHSGLAEAADAIYVCVNGGDSDCLAIAQLVPDKALVISHGPDSQTEIPTLNVMRDWCRSHQEWYVLYHHTKGVSTPRQADGWRRRMQKNCVTEWRRCVQDLERGFDVCGIHWLTPQQNPGVIHSPFYGGNFWWATAAHINRLPALPPATWPNRYEAETWIGKSPQRPKHVDYHPGWPTPN